MKFGILILFSMFILPTKVLRAQDLQQGIETIVEDINPQGELFSATGPRVDWGPPPKFLSYQFYTYAPVNLTLREEDGSNEYRARIKGQDEGLFKVKFPIYLKEHLSIIGGIQAHYQRYIIEDAALEGNSIFRNLNDRKFEQLRFDNYINYTFTKKRFLGFKTGIQLSGDYANNSNTSFSNFIRIQHTGLLGKRYSEKFAMGGSYFLAFQPGRLTVYPAIYITYWKNEKVGFESVFPALINLYYHPFKKTFFTGSYSLKSNRYLLNATPVQYTENSIFTFNTIDVQMSLDIQQQVFSILWMTFSMGYNFNVRTKMSDSQRRDSEVLYNGSYTPGGFLSVTAALTIPKDLLDKKGIEEKE